MKNQRTLDSTDRSLKQQPKMDALMVMGAVMEWNERKQQWTFPTIIPRYSGAIVMGKARALAAVELEKSAEVLLVTGGVDTHPSTGEIHSRSIELSRLITDLGVAKEKVVPMGKGGNTLANVRDLAKYLETNPGVLRENYIGILCLSYQYERAKVMFDDEYSKNKFFQEHPIKIVWYKVEDVLKNKSPLHARHYENWAQAVDQKIVTVKDPSTNQPRTGKAGDITRELEEKGLKDFLSGKYNPQTK